MNEERFNLSLRKLLKEVGVTSQREIEKAVRGALDARQLTGTEHLEARITVELPVLGLQHVVDGSIDLE